MKRSRFAAVTFLSAAALTMGCDKDGKGGCGKRSEDGERYALLTPYPQGPSRKLSKGDIEVVFNYSLVTSSDTIKQYRSKTYDFELVMRYQPKLGDIRYSTVARESLPWLVPLDAKRVSATRSVTARWDLPGFERSGLPVQQLLVRETGGAERVTPPNCVGY